MSLMAAPANCVAEWYQDHHGWLCGWLRGKLGCAYSAADLAQDTFVRVLARECVPELREIILADGSRMLLDTNTAVDAEFSRDIRLTRFIVEQEPSATRVAVIEARVALHAARGPASAPILREGEVARFDRHGRIEYLRAKPSEAAWTRGMLALRSIFCLQS